MHRLSGALQEKGYSVWLDERELVPGDDLPQSISAAIKRARALVVVVSPAATRSEWLRYELSLATDRMIKGGLRLIPVLIGQDHVPEELGALLYADFRADFDAGLESVVRALEVEHRRRLAAARAKSEKAPSWWQIVDQVMSEVWGGAGFMDFSGEFVSRSLDYVSLSVPLDSDGRPYGSGADWRHDPEDGVAFISLECTYQTVQSYRAGDPLTESWFSEFSQFIDDLGAPRPAVMVISQRPPAFELPDRDAAEPRIGRREETYVIDLSGLDDSDEMRRVLVRARDVVVENELQDVVREGEAMAWDRRTVDGDELRFARSTKDDLA